MKRYYKYVALISLLGLNCSIVFGHKLILDKGISKNKSAMACITKTIKKLKEKGSPTHIIEGGLKAVNKTLTIHVSRAIKSPQISSISSGMKISLPHLYSRWCIEKDQRYIARKTNKKIKEKLNKELGKGVNELFTPGSLSDLYDQAVCAFQDGVSTSIKDFQEKNPRLYKLNEKTGMVYNLKGKRVKNKAILKWLVSYFQQIRIEGVTSHLVRGGKLKDKVEKEKTCEIKSNQCICHIEKTTLAPQYSLSTSGELIKVKFHHFVAMDYLISSPFVDGPENCGLTSEPENALGENLTPPPYVDEQPQGAPVANADNKKPYLKESKGVEGNKPLATTPIGTKVVKPLTAQEKAELDGLLNIPTLNASGISASGISASGTQGIYMPPASSTQIQLPPIKSAPEVSPSLSEVYGEDPHELDRLMEGEVVEDSDDDEDSTMEERSIMDSGGNIYTSTRVFSPNGFVRQLKENEFVCYKPQYSQDNQVSIFRFDQEDLDAISFDNETDDDVFLFFNYVCLKKPEPEVE